MERLIFCDTYALYEFLRGNARYRKYFSAYRIVTTQLNLIELFYHILKEFGKDRARECYASFELFAEPYGADVIERAMTFRLEEKRRRLSYADCLGYAFALTHRIRFLTGDKAFRDLPRVEFVPGNP